jgi:hypothetical protein
MPTISVSFTEGGAGSSLDVRRETACALVVGRGAFCFRRVEWEAFLVAKVVVPSVNL